MIESRLTLSIVDGDKVSTLEIDIESRSWDDVLHNIVTHMEAHYGYTFDIEPETLGIWYKGKES